jgi:hypothetical protein
MGVRIQPQRVRQELKPEVANWEVIDYRLCIQYANGVLDKADYRKFLTEIAPTLQQVSREMNDKGSHKIHQESHDRNSPNVGVVGGNVRIETSPR